MIVHTAVDGAELRDPDDCTRFAVAAAPGVAAADVAGLLSGFGDLDPDGEHAWILVDAVRVAAGGRVQFDWDDRFAAMLAHAGSKGWLDPRGTAIRAHLEHPT